MFSKLKALLRKPAERTVPKLCRRIRALLRTISDEECLNFSAMQAIRSSLETRATLDFDDLQSAKNFGALAPAGCRARASPHMHPGFVATRFEDQSEGSICARARLAKFFAISPARGAETIVYLASSPDAPHDHRALLLRVPPDHAVGGGTRRPICFVAVAAQRSIGRHEGEWCAAALTSRGVIASSL